MKKYLCVLKRSKLFENVDEADIEAMLGCLEAREAHFSEGEYVYTQGQRIDRVSVLAEGRLIVQNDDYWGNRSIITAVSPGEMFGQAYLAGESVMNDVVAAEDSVVISFDAERILTSCSSACRFHAAVTRNLCYSLSEANLRLVNKLAHMSKRTTREKLMSYLSFMAKQAGSSAFAIPFDRQQLADFLSVDRSAMSTELGKMRKEGLITYKRNRFSLNQ